MGIEQHKNTVRYEESSPEEQEKERELEEREESRKRVKERRRQNRKEKRKLKELQSRVWWAVEERGTHQKRSYVSRRKREIKRASNKKLRQTREVGNGSGYRKVYDYWWELF